MPSWLDLLMGGQAPQFPQGQPPSPDFVPQRMAIAPTFAQAPQMAQDVAAGIADPLLKAGNYLGGIMQGSQQFSWPETIQHGAALAMAMAPGPKGERLAAGAERGLARVAGEAAGGQLAGQVKPPVDVGTVPGGIRAYHGSPYDFPAFDINKIGTGEGAQAYGHGLYFAENEATAKAYRDALAGAALPSADASASVNALWSKYANKNGDVEFGGFMHRSPDSLIALAQKNKGLIDTLPPELADAVRAQTRPGKMYEVNIKAQPEQFLDWDKPLSQQNPIVQKFFEDPKQTLFKPDMTGAEAHRMIASGQEAQVTESMRNAGIPGIRYLDQGSRIGLNKTDNVKVFHEPNARGDWSAQFYAADGTPMAGERFASKNEAQAWVSKQQQGTHNYVVFNDKLIDIMRKYGLIGALGGSMSAPYFAPQGQQQ